jgi:hypothetical protein
MDGRGAPLDRRYSFTRQRERQLLLSASFSVLCFGNLVDNLAFGGRSTYDTILFSVSLCGILAAILGSVGVLFHNKELLYFYLVYILGTLAFCVLYHVFQLGTRGQVHDFLLLGLSILMVILIWVQLFYSLYFLRLLTLYDVYHSDPLVRASCLLATEYRLFLIFPCRVHRVKKNWSQQKISQYCWPNFNNNQNGHKWWSCFRCLGRGLKPSISTRSFAVTFFSFEEGAPLTSIFV